MARSSRDRPFPVRRPIPATYSLSWPTSAPSGSRPTCPSRTSPSCPRSRTGRSASPPRPTPNRISRPGSFLSEPSSIPRPEPSPLLAEAENPGDLLKPNMFVQITARQLEQPSQVLTVPAKRDHRDRNREICVCARRKGHAITNGFTLRPVEIGRQSGDRVEIKSGLNASDRSRRHRRVPAQERADSSERDR